MDTVVKVSSTVDKAHDATVEVVKDATDYVVAHAGDIKEKVISFVNDKTSPKQVDELKEPSPEDIIGG